MGCIAEYAFQLLNCQLPETGPFSVSPVDRDVCHVNLLRRPSQNYATCMSAVANCPSPASELSSELVHVFRLIAKLAKRPSHLPLISFAGLLACTLHCT